MRVLKLCYSSKVRIFCCFNWFVAEIYHFIENKWATTQSTEKIYIDLLVRKWKIIQFKINSNFFINVCSIQYNIFVSFSLKVYAVTLLVQNFHVPRPNMFTSVYSETCNTKVHQVLQVATNGVSDIVFAQCQIHKTHQPTVTDLRNMTNEVHSTSTM